MNRTPFLLSLLLVGILAGTIACRPAKSPATNGPDPAGASLGDSPNTPESDVETPPVPTDGGATTGKSAPVTPPGDDPETLALLQRLDATLLRDDQGLVCEVRVTNGPVDELLPRLDGLPQLRSLTLSGTDVGNEQLANIPELPHLTQLNLFDTQVGDAGIEQLGRLPSLRQLSLSATRLTDEGLASLGRLRQLETLDISWTDVTGKSLASLAELPKLRSLDLSWTPVEDQHLDQLRRLTQLRQLVVKDTNLTSAALEQLREELPDTKVEAQDAVAAAIQSGPDRGDMPAAAGVGDVYRLAASEFQAARNEFLQRYGRAATEGEREQIAAQPPSPRSVAERLWKLAEENPDHPAAVDALAWIVQADDRFLQDMQEAAVKLLVERYADDPKLGEVCLQLGASTNPATQQLLRGVVDATSQAEIRGRARFALARLLQRRASEARQVQQMDEITRNQSIHLEGTLRVGRLLDARPSELQDEARELFRKVADEHAQVDGLDQSLGELARKQLFSLERLGIGKEAPEIRGEDIDGRPLHLSEHRGKVVVLTFWGNWCGPCRQMYPHERELVERLRDKPFVLLGVNSDGDRELLKQVMDQEQITWQSWWDGGSTQGPIARAWSIDRWPTIFVLDAEGVIRYKDVRGDALDQAVDALLRELEATSPENDAPKNDAQLQGEPASGGG